MTHSRKGGRRKPVPVLAPGPLGKWGAIFSSRGNKLFQLEPAGPLVEASTPEELAEKTAQATERKGSDDIN